MKLIHKYRKANRIDDSIKNNEILTSAITLLINNNKIIKGRMIPKSRIKALKNQKMKRRFPKSFTNKITMINKLKEESQRTQKCTKKSSLEMVFVPRIGDYSYYMKFFDCRQTTISPFHTEFKKLSSCKPTYCRLFAMSIKRMLELSIQMRDGHGGMYPLERTVKIALIFGEERYNFMKRITLIENTYKNVFNGIKDEKKIINHIVDHFRESLNSWANHVIQVFSMDINNMSLTSEGKKKKKNGIYIQDPKSVDEFIHAFENQNKWFSKDNLRRTTRKFNRAIKKSGGTFKLLNPKYFL